MTLSINTRPRTMIDSLSWHAFALLTLAVVQLAVAVRNLEPIRTPTRVIALALLFAGVVDNTSMAFGAYIGNYTVLKFFTIIRLAVHAVLVPCLLISTAELVRFEKVQPFSYVLAFVLALHDLNKTFGNGGLDLELVKFAGTVRLRDVTAEFPLTAIFVNIVIILAGIFKEKRFSSNKLLIGGVVSLIGNALPIPRFGPLPGVLGEAALSFFMLKAERELLTNSVEKKLRNQ